jgi:putative two-component system response regulator
MIDPEFIRRSRILAVDDDEANLSLLKQVLEHAGYTELLTLSDSTSVESAMERFDPDLLILDLHMPIMDGFELLKKVRANARRDDMPILVFTADATSPTKYEALDLGASDFLTKPGDIQEILLRVKNFLHTHHLQRQLKSMNDTLEEKVQHRTQALWDSQKEMLHRLSRAVEYRDDDTGEHTRRVGELAARLAEGLGLSRTQVELIRLAAPLHDVGKVGIPDSILLKRGKLTEEEMTVVRQHTEIGGNILSDGRSPLLQIAEIIARTHHERWDGRGYHGLAGEDIPIEGRIVAVADAFDVMTNDRPYKEAWPLDEALAEVENNCGKQFDPKVVDALFQVVNTRLIEEQAHPRLDRKAS